MWGMVAGPYLAAALLLAAAGAQKLAAPKTLVLALREAGLPVVHWHVRLFAGFEVVVGVWAVLAPGRLPASLVAASYLVFTAFVLLALRRGHVLSTCGCFGKPDTPPTRTHAAVTGLLALTAIAVAADPPASAWSDPGLAGLVTAGYAALIALLCWAAMAVLPTVSPRAVRGRERS